MDSVHMSTGLDSDMLECLRYDALSPAPSQRPNMDVEYKIYCGEEVIMQYALCFHGNDAPIGEWLLYLYKDTL